MAHAKKICIVGSGNWYPSQYSSHDFNFDFLLTGYTCY